MYENKIKKFSQTAVENYCPFTVEILFETEKKGSILNNYCGACLVRSPLQAQPASVTRFGP